MVLLGAAVDSRAVRFGNSKLSSRQAILSPNWNSRHYNHMGMMSLQAQQRRAVAVEVAASQSLVLVAGALEWWDTQCGDASNTKPFCLSAMMMGHQRHNWDLALAWLLPGVAVGVEAAVLGPGVASKAWQR